MLCTAHGMLAPDEVEDYKKNHISDILKQLEEISNGEVSINEDDIVFSMEESEEA